MKLESYAAKITREPLLIIALALSSGAVWAFVELADEVLEGESHEVDKRIVLALRNPADAGDPIGPLWFEELMRDVTALGGVGVLTLVVGVATTFFWTLGRRQQAVLLLVALGGGLLLGFSMKYFFDRPRPDLVPHGSHVYTRSFPSGHSMMSAVVYLTLGAVVAELVRSRRLRLFLIALAVALTLAVGASRVYLGVHWPTDVLAGWSIGAAWALACWAIARVLHLRRLQARSAENT